MSVSRFLIALTENIVTPKNQLAQLPPNPTAAQPQPIPAQDNAASGTVPASTGAEATTTKSQPIAAGSDQPENGFLVRMKTAGMTSHKIGYSELLYRERFRDEPKWFERLENGVPWSPEMLKMFNKPLVLRRETCNYGENYDYNVNAKPAIEWDGPVFELKQMLEEFTGRKFTQCACNLYPDGDTGIGLHHDKRHPLLVASISFGAVRTIGFAPKGGKLDKSLPMIPLASGSLLLFTDAVNDNFKHTIIEDKSVRAPRISVTFREFATGDKKADKVTRQMSPNSTLPAITVRAFQSVADFVNAYETTDKTIADRTGKFVDAIDEAKQKQDDIVPYLAYMQSLLSKKGSNHHLVIEARKNGKNIPWWTDYFTRYKTRLWESLRTMERRIDAYRKDPSVPTKKVGNGNRSDKPKHLTQLEHKLLGTATTVHEALTDIRAGRIDDAVKKLKENVPTQDRIEEYLQHGVKPTLAGTDGNAKPQADNSEQQTDSKERIEPPSPLPISARPETATFDDWAKHKVPNIMELKLRYFEDAVRTFVARFYHAFSDSSFRKIQQMVKEDPASLRVHEHDFAKFAAVLRAAADNLNLLAVAMTSPTPVPEVPAESVEQQESQDLQQDAGDLAASLNEKPGSTSPSRP